MYVIVSTCFVMVNTIIFVQSHLLFCLYVCYCFYAYCDGEYYYSFVMASAVGKQVMCGVYIYNKIFILVYEGGHLLLVA